MFEKIYKNTWFQIVFLIITVLLVAVFLVDRFTKMDVTSIETTETTPATKTASFFGLSFDYPVNWSAPSVYSTWAQIYTDQEPKYKINCLHFELYPYLPFESDQTLFQTFENSGLATSTISFTSHNGLEIANITKFENRFSENDGQTLYIRTKRGLVVANLAPTYPNPYCKDFNYDKFLSSLKRTEEQTTKQRLSSFDLSTWSTLKDETLGLSIRYPRDWKKTVRNPKNTVSYQLNLLGEPKEWTDGPDGISLSSFPGNFLNADLQKRLKGDRQEYSVLPIVVDGKPAVYEEFGGMGLTTNILVQVSPNKIIEISDIDEYGQEPYGSNILPLLLQNISFTDHE